MEKNAKYKVDTIIDYLYKLNNEEGCNLSKELFKRMGINYNNHDLRTCLMYDDYLFFVGQPPQKISSMHLTYLSLYIDDDTFKPFKEKVRRYFEIKEEQDNLINFLSVVVRKFPSYTDLECLLPSILLNLFNKNDFTEEPSLFNIDGFKKQHQNYLDVIKRRLTFNLLN